MSDFSIRPWRAGDKTQLKALWQTAFGDPEEFINSFFDAYLHENACVVAEADGQVVSAMYILPGQVMFPYRKNQLTAGYTYALATLPAYRGRGIGRAVYKAASEKALETADAACVLPAEESLYPFYENASGATPVSFLREARLTKADLAAAKPCMAARFPIAQYAGMREQLLRGLPHVFFPEEMYELLEASGVEFFVLEHGVAAAETGEDGVCRVRELLYTEEDVMNAVAAVARWCPAQEYVVRTPLFYDGPGEPRPYMLAALREPPSYPMPKDLWWGFGLE